MSQIAKNLKVEIVAKRAELKALMVDYKELRASERAARVAVREQKGLDREFKAIRSEEHTTLFRSKLLLNELN